MCFVHISKVFFKFNMSIFIVSFRFQKQEPLEHYMNVQVKNMGVIHLILKNAKINDNHLNNKLNCK